MSPQVLNDERDCGAKYRSRAVRPKCKRIWLCRQTVRNQTFTGGSL